MRRFKKKKKKNFLEKKQTKKKKEGKRVFLRSPGTSLLKLTSVISESHYTDR